MAKTIDNTRLNDLGEVWVAKTLNTANPAEGEEFDLDDWTEVGLLDGSEGFTTSREEEKTPHYAWSVGKIREARKNFEMRRTFTVLEDNETTRGLIWPGSTETAIFTPKPEPIKLAFVTRDGDKVKREFTAKHAIVEVDGDLTENEDDLTKATLAADIYPEVTGEGNKYFEVQRFEAGK